MPDTHSPDRPAWRETVRRAAYEATLTEAQLRWGKDELAFNYRWEHVQATVRLGLKLAELTGADQEIVEAAAWLHDICKRGRDDNHGPDGARAAGQLLAATDFPPHKIQATADAIDRHVGLFTDEPVEPLEAAVLWDADKLTKLGATSVLNFAGYHIAKGETTTPELIDRLADQSWQEKTVASFHTAPARAAGTQRLRTYQALVQALAAEFHGDDLG